MRRLRGVAAVGALALALRAAAAPFHGCTFFEPQLLGQSMACAQFTNIYGACTIYHCSPFGCLIYPGWQFDGWMPDYFLEVTNRAGESAFTSGADMVLHRLQMGKAAANWIAHGDPFRLSTKGDLPRDGHDYSMYYGRGLPIPWGAVGWYLYAADVKSEGGLPKCFAAITEDVAETWSDSWTPGAESGDRKLAAAWSTLTAPVCVYGAPLMGAIATIPTPSLSLGSMLPCAFPIPAGWQEYLALTGGSAYDVSKQCMGSLGPLLPRSGFTEGETYTAAERVAWRTASLAEDYFRTGIGVQGADKWQIIHPLSTGMCFKPGSLTRPSLMNGGEVFVRTPPAQYDQQLLPEHETDYVFAVWRKRSKCLEPPQGLALQAELAAFVGIHKAECAAFSAVSR
jgi:hypothetical protein